MIVDIEHPCILNGVILFRLFQGQKVKPVDFPLTVKACLAAGYGQWNLPASHLFWAFLKKDTKKQNTGLKLITFPAYSLLSAHTNSGGLASISFTEFAERQKRLKFPNCQCSGIWKSSAKSSRLKMDLLTTLLLVFVLGREKRHPSLLFLIPFSLVRRSLCARSCIVKAAYDSSMETLIMSGVESHSLLKSCWHQAKIHILLFSLTFLIMQLTAIENVTMYTFTETFKITCWRQAHFWND